MNWRWGRGTSQLRSETLLSHRALEPVPPPPSLAPVRPPIARHPETRCSLAPYLIAYAKHDELRPITVRFTDIRRCVYIMHTETPANRPPRNPYPRCTPAMYLGNGSAVFDPRRVLSSCYNVEIAISENASRGILIHSVVVPRIIRVMA